MNNPILFSQTNHVSRRDTEYLLNKYFHTTKWLINRCDLVMDIGCGDGDVTAQILLNKIPSDNLYKIIGTDRSSEMIQFASDTHKNNKLEFQKFDISSDYLPREFSQQFHHVFSFYCLHWVQNQRKAFENIFNMLKPGGDTLIGLLANNPLFVVYEKMSVLPKWSKYMFDWRNHVSPFQKSLCPQKDLQLILKDIGFNVQVCNSELFSYTFDTISTCITSNLAVNPFIGRIPDNLKEDFANEHLNQIEKMNLIFKNNDGTESVTFRYNILVVCAYKN